MYPMKMYEHKYLAFDGGISLNYFLLGSSHPIDTILRNLKNGFGGFRSLVWVDWYFWVLLKKLWLSLGYEKGGWILQKTKCYANSLLIPPTNLSLPTVQINCESIPTYLYSFQSNKQKPKPQKIIRYN